MPVILLYFSLNISTKQNKTKRTDREVISGHVWFSLNWCMFSKNKDVVKEPNKDVVFVVDEQSAKLSLLSGWVMIKPKG